MSRIRIVIGLALIALLASIQPASAGGWATIAPSTPLESVVAGEEFDVEFRVLAHNNPDTPVTGMETTLLLTNTETGFFAAAHGEPTGDPEVYTATFTLADPGEWELRGMIHNYLPDGELLWTSPDPVIVTGAT